jgi:hypothetical protein
MFWLVMETFEDLNARMTITMKANGAKALGQFRKRSASDCELAPKLCDD